MLLTGILRGVSTSPAVATWEVLKGDRGWYAYTYPVTAFSGIRKKREKSYVLSSWGEFGLGQVQSTDFMEIALKCFPNSSFNYCLKGFTVLKASQSLSFYSIFFFSGLYPAVLEGLFPAWFTELLLAVLRIKSGTAAGRVYLHVLWAIFLGLS